MMQKTLTYLLLFVYGQLCLAGEKQHEVAELKKRHLQNVAQYRQHGKVDVLWTRVADEYPPAKKYLNRIRISLKNRIESKLRDGSFHQIRLTGIQDPSYHAFINFVHLSEYFSKETDICKMFLLMEKHSLKSAETVFRIIESTLLRTGYLSTYLKYVGSLRLEFERVKKLRGKEFKEFQKTSRLDAITQKELTDKAFLLRVQRLLKTAKALELKQDFDYIYIESEKKVPRIRQTLLSGDLGTYSETIPYPYVEVTSKGK